METPAEFPTCDWCKRYLHRHMDAYYYGFDATGEKLIDNILCSVASAGKAFHNTDGWNEGGCTEVIQEAANAAKAELTALKARCADLELMLRAAVNDGFDTRQRSDNKEWTLSDDAYTYYFGLDDDGTGLPLLTAEAREALKGAGRG